MANAKNLLDAAKKQKQNGSKPAVAQKQPRQMLQEAFVSTDLNALENMYFNPQEQNNDPLNEAYEVYPNGQKRKVYDPEEDMKELASFSVNQATSKMPKAILESMIKNPLNMPTDHIEASGDIMDEALQNRTMDILDKLEARDRQGKPAQQRQQPQPVYNQQSLNEDIDYNLGSDIDYKKIAQIIEAVVDKKLGQYKQVLLNESRNGGQNAPKVSFLKLGDTFTFMDDANNVYECKMVYKGKGKVKQN